jgi:hypothetical protein
MNTTTGSNIEHYVAWLTNEVEHKRYGEVSITFVVTDSIVTLVRKSSTDSERFGSR